MKKIIMKTHGETYEEKSNKNCDNTILFLLYVNFTEK